MFSTNKSTSLQLRTWALGVLLACFATLTVFEPFLHAHELDPTHVEQNCAACHWSQTHLGADLPSTDAVVFEPFFENLIVQHRSPSVFPRYSISSRAPPGLH